MIAQLHPEQIKNYKNLQSDIEISMNDVELQTKFHSESQYLLPYGNSETSSWPFLCTPNDNNNNVLNQCCDCRIAISSDMDESESGDSTETTVQTIAYGQILLESVQNSDSFFMGDITMGKPQGKPHLQLCCPKKIGTWKIIL